MFEIKHLKTLATLANTGNIRKAADELFVSQSALSHQLKDLELRLKTKLFIRNSSPIQFTAKGEILLQLAQEFLPKINKTLSELNTENNTQTQLNIAIACHACFQWLLPLTKQFSQQYPKVKITFSEQIFPTETEDKSSPKIDILFTDEKIENNNYIYQAIGIFEVVAVFAKQQNLSDTAFISATDISQHVLLSYPVKPDQLDIFKLFLNKQTKNSQGKNICKFKPKAIKQVANSHMILQMVAANMGFASLPDWLVNSLTHQSLVQTKAIGEKGIYKTLYARYPTKSQHTDIIERLIPQTVAAFNKLYNTDNVT
ncbi:MAG: LysR substrate-binding domain-containing protein [Colwellia sp.]